MFEKLRELLSNLLSVSSGFKETPEALEKRKVFESFLLAEYNNIANAHFNTVDSIATFMKNYIVIASVPFFVIGVLLSAKQAPDNALLVSVTHNPMVPGALMTGLSVVGLCVLGYVVNIRCDAILYARVVNGIRFYFYRRADLETSDEAVVRVLPSDVRVPPYFEPTYFGFVVAVFAIIGASYFWVGLYYLELALASPNSYLIALCTILRAGSGFSDRSVSGMTAIFFHNSRSIPDETTETQPLAGIQGEGGFGSHQRREDARSACCAL